MKTYEEMETKWRDKIESMHSLPPEAIKYGIFLDLFSFAEDCMAMLARIQTVLDGEER